jgi:hypothetical protein
MSVLILTIITFSSQNDLVSLTETEDQKIFSFGDQRYHPYASDSSSRYKFHIPKSIDAKNTNKHGQLQSVYLDEIFDYAAVDLSDDLSDGRIEYDSSRPPNLNTKLKKWLADRFMEKDLFDTEYQYFKKCSTSKCNDYFA